MEPRKRIVQSIKRIEEDNFSLAERYYSIISIINNLKLTQREIQLVAFTSIKGNISYANNMKEFCEKYKSTSHTIYNIISKLKKIGVLIKDGTKIKTNPAICLSFNNDITLEIKLIYNG